MDMEQINAFVKTLNGFFFHDYVVYALLFTGVLFTLWSVFGQYYAMTHGVAVIRGKYDKKDDPGAINHFQALSAALSATIGLGNIGGVALAIALGGPGAVFWMWVIGVLGMALKMVEVSQSMLFRNTDDPDNPHGGPMFVVETLFKNKGGRIGATIGGLFSMALILSAITGGNMFQAWNVADVTTHYFDLPLLADIQASKNFNPESLAIGIVLAILVGAVIIGGIKRIGKVAGRLVPLMCLLYVLAGIVVLFINIQEIPQMIMLIIGCGLGLAEAEVGGAFLGGTAGFAFLWGVKRALFSSEAGQGSAPVAHSAAKCQEPIREGVVAGIGPFIDTLIVCTMTALIILSSGAWNRGAEAEFADASLVKIVENEKGWTLETPPLPERNAEAKRISRIRDGKPSWKNNDTVFLLLEAEQSEDQGTSLHRIKGKVVATQESEETPPVFTVKWDTHKFPKDDQGKRDETVTTTLHSPGILVDYKGATLTAHAFDRVIPGLGKWLVVIAAWLFALSTMISWSYYGEQGIFYFFGKGIGADIAVLAYRLIYTILIAVTTIGFIETEDQLDMWTTLGMGAMLVVNIPIMLLFARRAMKAYHDYIRRLKAGQFVPHDAPSIEDVVSGHDVE